ncbi:hypothetical protein F5144DRAFT_635289 [Chaetomium tenue]|uniref:Uncharacterized protein n=1 Tax=Chaetomium tenue TaxID=1854479 RepID=A0ACB7PJZ9_9PEZI|nr:hypothetical protein F5144DRAFT_635289 [Chaetomium globosum]
MVSFRSLIASATLIATPLMAALTPTQLYDAIDKMAQDSHDLQAVAESVTVVNAQLVYVEQGPIIPLVEGLERIARTAGDAVEQCAGTSPITNNSEASLYYYNDMKLLRILNDKARLPILDKKVRNYISVHLSSQKIYVNNLVTLITAAKFPPFGIDHWAMVNNYAGELLNELEYCQKQWGDPASVDIEIPDIDELPEDLEEAAEDLIA